MRKNSLYLLLSLACLAGYAWLAASYIAGPGKEDETICLVKLVTGIPCPSCGSTRSVLSLVQGHVREAFFWNPVGIILVLIMAVAPVWLGYDLLLKKDTLYRFYGNMEILLRKKAVAIPAIALVLANWAWNIYKGL